MFLKSVMSETGGKSTARREFDAAGPEEKAPSPDLVRSRGVTYTVARRI